MVLHDIICTEIWEISTSLSMTCLSLSSTYDGWCVSLTQSAGNGGHDPCAYVKAMLKRIPTRRASLIYGVAESDSVCKWVGRTLTMRTLYTVGRQPRAVNLTSSNLHGLD